MGQGVLENIHASSSNIDAFPGCVVDQTLLYSRVCDEGRLRQARYLWSFASCQGCMSSGDTLICLKQKYLSTTFFSLEFISRWNDQKEKHKLPFCSARSCTNDPALTRQCRCHSAYCDPRIARLIAPVPLQFSAGASGSSHLNPSLDLKWIFNTFNLQS